MRVDFDKDRIKSLKLVPVEANEILKTQKMQKKNSKAYISKVMSRRSCREGHVEKVFRKGQNLTISVSLSSELYPAQNLLDPA